MKHLLFTTILLCFTYLLMAQSDSSNPDNPYAETWSEIDSLWQLGRPQSVYDLLTGLRAQIEQDLLTDASLYPYHINAILAEQSAKVQLGENDLWQSILDLEQIREAAQLPDQAIYSSYLAEHYFQYWQRNSWQLRNRTERPGAEKTEDPTSWSSQNLLTRVNELYLSSVADTTLRNYDIKEILPLLVTKDQGVELLPTVYDLLLHRAISYYRYNDAFLNEPAYEPNLQKLDLFSSVEKFVVLELPVTERQSSFQHLIQLYQEVLSWSAENRPNTHAHLDLNLARLEIMYQQLTGETKHAKYERALEALRTDYEGEDLQAFGQTALMKFYYERGAEYSGSQTSDESLRWYWKRAFELAEDLKERFPESVTVQDALATINLIKQQQLTVLTEQVQLPQKASLLGLRYRNVESVHFKLVPASPERTEYNDWEQFINQLLGQKAEKVWSVDLPQAGDYRQHTTEFILPALAKGKYFLIASAYPDFPLENSQTNVIEFWVSDLAVVYEIDENEREVAVLVVERTSGRPIPSVEVRLWEYQRRNRSEQRNRLALVGTEQTDSDGRAILRGREIRNTQVQVIAGDDQLFLSESQYLSPGRRRSQKNKRLAFFTDRGLYRPGQTLYFKALLLEEDDHMPGVVPNEQVEVSLLDANQQVVSTLTLKTNRFGSVSGQFTLPSGGLLGQMSLSGKPGRNWHPIRVEEYKRPRFEVKLNDLQDEPQLNDIVTVAGNAKAYTGPAIAEATIKYSVTRSIRFPWSSPWFRSYFYQPQEQTIANGTTKSDAQGQFSFTFTAEADADLSQDRHPLYTFNVQVEVVDETGETRATSKFIQLSKYPFELALNTALTQDRAAGIQLEASCRNLDGQDLAKTIHLRILRRENPKRNYIQRYWPFPDTVVLEERAFRKQLPTYAYTRQELEQYWPDGESIWSQSMEINGTDTIDISTVDWPVGHYKAILEVRTVDGDTLRKETSLR